MQAKDQRQKTLPVVTKRVCMIENRRKIAVSVALCLEAYRYDILHLHNKH